MPKHDPIDAQTKEIREIYLNGKKGPSIWCAELTYWLILNRNIDTFPFESQEEIDAMLKINDSLNKAMGKLGKN